MSRANAVVKPSISGGALQADSGNLVKRPHYSDDGTLCPICPRFQNDTDKCPLSSMVPGGEDALHNRILELCWIGQDYIIYRSNKGVDIHFSDCSKTAQRQRELYESIGPQLCQIRYLTGRMGLLARFGLRKGNPAHYYDHQLVQAIVGALECPSRQRDNSKLLSSVLDLAVTRVTNENRVIYLASCFLTTIGVLLLSFLLVRVPWQVLAGVNITAPLPSPGLPLFFAAGVFGAVGAFLSIAMRVQSLELVPCRESFMNLVMGILRVAIGTLSGGILLLLLYATNLHAAFDSFLSSANNSMYPAVIGILGGFAERLVPHVLLSAETKLEPANTDRN
jgi:hypothetical protein